MGNPVGRLKDGDLMIKGNLVERLPLIKDGLILHYPLDGNLNRFKSISVSKVLGWYSVGVTSHPWYDWFNSNSNFSNTTDILSITVDQAKQYDLIVADCYVWAVDPAVINKLKEFVDAGVSCVVAGNDTRENYFVAQYSGNTKAIHSVDIDINAPIQLSGSKYDNMSGDVYGGIAKLQNGATPIYYRNDQNLIMGYFYESLTSKAILYFDQEGFGINEISIACFQYALYKSNGNVSNSNVTFQNTGISIEGPTSNLVNTTSGALGGIARGYVWYDFVKDINDYVLSNTPIGLINVAHVVWHVDDAIDPVHTMGGGIELGGISDLITVAPNSTYTYSYFIKFRDNNEIIDANFIYIREYDGTSTQVEEAGYANEINKIDLGNGWFRIWGSFTTRSTTQKINIQHYSYYNLGDEVWFFGSQLEQNNFMTAFITNNRSSNGYLEFPVNIDSSTSQFTLNYWIAPNGNNILDTNALIQLNNFGKIWSYYPTSSDAGNRRYIWDYTVASIRAYRDLVSTTLFQPGFFEMITIAWDLTAVSIYRNGILWSTLAKTADCTIGVIDKIIFSKIQGTIRDVSLYNKNLNSNDIKKLFSSQFKLLNDGTLIKNKIQESPNYIPSDAYYFSLSFDSSDKTGCYSASEIYSVVHEFGSVWVGKSTTNLIPESDIINLAGQNEIFKSMATNIIGVAGNCEQIGALGTGGILDTTTKMSGNSSIKVGYSWDFYFDTNGKLTTGHKYYISAYTKTDSTLYSPRIDLGAYSIYGTSTNEWQRISDVFGYETLAAQNVIYFLLTASDPGKYAWFDEIMFIDLTATFGAGNEPATSGECDTIFSTWFGGSFPTDGNFSAIKQQDGFYKIPRISSTGHTNTGISMNKVYSVVAGNTYTESFYFKHDGTNIDFKISFYTTQNNLVIPTIIHFGNGLHRAFATYTMETGISNVKAIEISEMSGDFNNFYIKDIQLEKKYFPTPSLYGTRGNSSLEYNFNSSLKLDWSQDWSIVYWKKPIGTTTDDLTAFNIESLGCNSNSVGGGYLWWGKTTGSNSISNGTPNIFNPNDYFNKWHMVSLIKSGSTLIIKEWDIGNQIVSRTVNYSGIASNYFVTQYGYDFKLGGFDNGSPPNTYYRDLIVLKRALTDNEILNIFKSQMTSHDNQLQIQNSLKEWFIL